MAKRSSISATAAGIPTNVEYGTSKLSQKFGAENVARLISMFNGDLKKVGDILHGATELTHFTMSYKPYTKFVKEEKGAAVSCHRQVGYAGADTTDK